MRVILTFSAAACWFVLGLASSAAQEDNAPASVKTTVCELGKDPDKYIGKLVSVRGWVLRERELKVTEPWSSPGCADELVIAYPEAVKPKPDFVLERDSTFLKLQQALSQRTHIEATFEGRFDSAVIVKDGKRVKVGKGFGHRHRAMMRLVLRRVSDLDIRMTRSVDR